MRCNGWKRKWNPPWTSLNCLEESFSLMDSPDLFLLTPGSQPNAGLRIRNEVEEQAEISWIMLQRKEEVSRGVNRFGISWAFTFPFSYVLSSHGYISYFLCLHFWIVHFPFISLILESSGKDYKSNDFQVVNMPARSWKMSSSCITTGIELAV